MTGTKTISRSSLRGLRTFCVAARYESFRAAADELYITSSAVSHQIKGLEEELGLQLFDRGSRELKLTDVGSSLYEEISPLIDQLDTIVADYRKSGRRKSVRISVQPFFASEFFVPRLSEFTAEHPDIDIQVGTSDESAEKHPADADLSVRLFHADPYRPVKDRRMAAAERLSRRSVSDRALPRSAVSAAHGPGRFARLQEVHGG